MGDKFFYEKFDSLYYYHGSTENWKMKGFHLHNQYEIILFLCDGVRMEVGNRIYPARTGDLFLLNNKEYHRTVVAAGQKYNRYVLMFEEEVLLSGEKMLGYEFAKFFRNRPDNFLHRLHLDGGALEEIRKKFETVGAIANEKNGYAHDARLAMAILELVLSVNEKYDFFLKEGGEDQNAYTEHELEFKKLVSQSDRIEQIKEYVTEHIQEKLEVSEIAKEFYISSYYLSHHFKQETGFTLLEYIMNQKTLAAAAMLKDGLSVTEVAGRLSYNSDSHFISTFKKMTGITPKKFAEER